MSSRLARIALWSGLGVALGITGYLIMNTTFMIYDDEGFVLISLRNYLAGLRLYDDIFSQYGPWPYVYHQIITTLGGGAEMTHTLGRAITLTHWVATCLLCGGITWRVTRSQGAALATAIITFGITWQMIAEPTHPGSLICLLVALAGMVVTLLPESRRPMLLYGILGLLGGLLLLTKINVGLLFVAGLGGFALRHTAWPARGQGIAWLGLVGLLALPWVLLGRQLTHGWVLIFAVQFTLAAAGLLWLARLTPGSRRLDARAWPLAPLVAAGAIGVVSGVVLLRGTTLAALIQTVLLNPVRMPARFMVPVGWLPETWGLAVAGGLLVARCGWELRRHGRLARVTTWLVVIARGAVLGAFVLNLRTWPGYLGIFHYAADCLPLLPVFLVPLSASVSEPDRLARWGVAWIALPQVLHAFPVAGSQLGWATFLCVPLFVAGLWETGPALRELAAGTGRRIALAGGLVVALACVLLLGLMAQSGWGAYSQLRPLELPGAEDIHLNGKTRLTMRLLRLNSSIHADLLFSRQGMYSHNLWSGVPTPTAQNATHWFWLLDDRQQREIIARLASTPRTAVITCTYLDELLVKLKVTVDGPLQDFVQQHYQPLFQYQGFIFHVPAGSHAVPFGRFEMLESGSADPKVAPLLIRTNVLLDGTPASIRLEMLDYPWTLGPDLLTAGRQVLVQPIDRNGHDIGPAQPLTGHETLRGLYRLSIFGPLLPPKLAWQEYALVVRDANDRVLSESAY